MDEMFDIVDEDGRVIGRAARSECHGNPKLLHRAVHVLLFDSQGRLYLQKRAQNKDVQPGKWDSSVGGHVGAGEDYASAARREMSEELGISGLELVPLYDYLWRSEMESERIRTYRAQWDGPVSPDPGEIEEGRFWSSEEILRALGAGLFTPNFEDEYRRWQVWTRGASASPDRPQMQED